MDNKQKNLNNLRYVPCPECDTLLTIPSKSAVGEVLECSACATENEIVSLDPFKLSPLEEEK